MVQDPVCGMEIEEREAVGKSLFEGTTFYFCAPSCKKAFEKEPEKYVKKLSYTLDSHHSNS